MAKVCSGCVEAVSCFGEHVVTRDYEYKSQVCRNEPSATRVHKRLGELRRNVFAMSAQFEEDEMHVHEQLDASFNAPKERNPPSSIFSSEPVDLLDPTIPCAIPQIPPPQRDTRKRTFQAIMRDL